MSAWRPALAAVAVALMPLSPALAQGAGVLSPELEPAADSGRFSLLVDAPAAPEPASAPWGASANEAPAWKLALWGVVPYAELQAAGLPLPPSPAEVAHLTAPARMQEQAAMKAVWLERLIRAREERHRITRENLAHSALQAQKLGAPSVFVDLLRRQAAGGMPARQRHLLETAQQAMFTAYEVDSRELRYFVESCGLSAEQLRDVAAWLPLPALFETPLPASAAPVSPHDIGKNYVEFLAVRRDIAAIWKGVTDLATADAAADALLPVLVRHLSASRPLMAVSEEQRRAVLAPYARFASPVMSACSRERKRLQEQAWYGSHRLQAVDYLLH